MNVLYLLDCRSLWLGQQYGAWAFSWWVCGESCLDSNLPPNILAMISLAGKARPVTGYNLSWTQFANTSDPIVRMWVFDRVMIFIVRRTQSFANPRTICRWFLWGGLKNGKNWRLVFAIFSQKNLRLAKSAYWANYLIFFVTKIYPWQT